MVLFFLGVPAQMAIIVVYVLCSHPPDCREATRQITDIYIHIYSQMETSVEKSKMYLVRMIDVTVKETEHQILKSILSKTLK